MLISTATVAIALLATTLAAAAALVAGRGAVRGTTLVAVWWWSAISLAAIASVEGLALAASLADPGWIAPARYLAAMSTFAPPMALLGAKRPQDRAWQWIVLSLWLILSLPAAERLLFSQGDEIHPAWFWFLMVLVFTGTCNGLLTRRWPASLLFGAAQIVLLAPHLATIPALEPPRAPLAALALLALSWWFTALGWPRQTAIALPLDRVWLDFRDAYGAVWALRVAQRVNDAATRLGWPVELAWQGFLVRDTGAAANTVPVAVEENLRTILRRFVSPDWIEQRMSEPPERP